MSFIEHIEKYLGEINKGWMDQSSDSSLQVIPFKDKPCESFNTYISLGLSKHELSLKKGKKIKIEFIMTVTSCVEINTVVLLLLDVCEKVIIRHKSVLRGDVIYLEPSLSKHVGFEGLYCTIPQYFDIDFNEYIENDFSTVIVWLIPLFSSEINFIQNNGWSDFEAILEKEDPDLWLFNRDSVCAPSTSPNKQ